MLQALPLAVTMGAALVFGEGVGWRRWLAIAVGFAGVLIIVRPGFDGFSAYSLWALASRRLLRGARPRHQAAPAVDPDPAGFDASPRRR